MTFAKWSFRVAGLAGLVIVAPMYFIERQYALDYPPAITHPEFYYGFVGVTLACQVMFLIVSSDPVRYRPMMVAAMVEKFAYVIATAWLILAGRAPFVLALTIVLDLTLGVLFVVAFVRTSAVASR